MMTTSTNEIETMLQHFVGGDKDVWRILVNQIIDRLRAIVRKERNKYFSGVKNDETDSILGEAYLKMSGREADLRNVLARTPPPLVRRFFSWCGQQIRDVLTKDQRRNSRELARASELRDRYYARDKCFGPENYTSTDAFFAIEQLPAEFQELFDLLYVNGLTLAEAAAILGVSIATVKRLRAKLTFQIAETLTKTRT